MSYPVGPCVWYGRFVWGILFLVAAAGGWAVVVGQTPSGLSMALALLAWLLAVCAVALHLALWPIGKLSWLSDEYASEPQGWVWESAQGTCFPVTVGVVWSDSQWVCLRLTTGGRRAFWVWASACVVPSEWISFRRAIVSSTGVN